MGDLVSSMSRERNSTSTYFLTFTRLVSRDNRATICFFEGEDQKYYGVRLNLIGAGLHWTGIDCKGKQNVLALHGLINNHSSYRDSSVAFFVDRDFDDPVPLEYRDRIYETPCYSIENLFCSDRCLTEVLRIEFKLDNNPNRHDLLQDVLEHFKTVRTQFHEHMRPVNIWIKAHRNKELREGLKKLNLNNVALDAFVCIKYGAIENSLIDGGMSSVFESCYELSENELREAGETLPSANASLVYRGKYELEFVRKYLCILKSKCSQDDSPFFNPGCSVKLTFNKGNFISEISQYAESPDCLKHFISKLAGSSVENCPVESLAYATEN